MERYKKPPLGRDFQYFLKVGLPSIGVNPHILKRGKGVANEKLIEMFEKAILQSSFYYIECHNMQVEIKVEKI
jgi:hypothetical protein